MKINIRIQNKGDLTGYLILHPSKDFYIKNKSIMVGAYFKEQLLSNGEIYNSITDNFQIAGLMESSIKSNIMTTSVTRRLDYHSGTRYLLTNDEIFDFPGPSYCVRCVAKENKSIILFCNERPIYHCDIASMTECDLPSISELMGKWTISYSTTDVIPTYFSHDMPVLTPLWTGHLHMEYNTFELKSSSITGDMSLSEPDFHSFCII